MVMKKLILPVLLLTFLLPALALRAAGNEKTLPTAVIIGDSVCISGYGKYVKETLKDTVDVKIGAATTSKWTLDGIDSALKRMLGNGKAAVIHFNCGIWDISLKSYDPDKGVFFADLKGKRATDPAQYERNLRELVRILKGRTDKLIWATTTPFSADSGRHQGDDFLYNKVAEIVMRENGVMIDDLNATVLPHLDQYQTRKGDVHFNQEGYQFLARKVSDSIFKALRGELKPEPFRINPDKPYTIEEREQLTHLPVRGKAPVVVPNSDRRGLYASHEMQGKSLLIHTTTGWCWKLTAYDHYVLRMQVSRTGGGFPADDRAALVKHPGEPSDLIVEETDTELKVRTWAMDGIPLKFLKQTMTIQWLWEKGILKESDGLMLDKNVATLTYSYNPAEQFYALPGGIELTGQSLKRDTTANDPASHPAFFSNRNYGMLMNVARPVWMELGGKRVKLAYPQDEEVDLFVIIGKDKEEITRRYTALLAESGK
jgi:lysophospholipase L1-like esterase